MCRSLPFFPWGNPHLRLRRQYTRVVGSYLWAEPDTPHVALGPKEIRHPLCNALARTLTAKTETHYETYDVTVSRAESPSPLEECPVVWVRGNNRGGPASADPLLGLT